MLNNNVGNSIGTQIEITHASVYTQLFVLCYEISQACLVLYLGRMNGAAHAQNQYLVKKWKESYCSQLAAAADYKQRPAIQ